MWLNDGLPVPELEGWSPVGESRLEWSMGNTSTDFDLLLLEEVLKDNGIECMFYPHRPNEGVSQGRPVMQAINLFVRDEQLADAQKLADELANAEIIDEHGDLEGGDTEDDL